MKTSTGYHIWHWRPFVSNNIVRLYSLVVVRNKLYVIGQDRCEVFHNIIKKFVVLKSSLESYANKAIPMGNKIVIVQDYTRKIICYDVDTNEWSEEQCEATKDRCDFSCVKIPRY